MTCNVRLQLPEVQCAVASCDVCAEPSLVATCDVRGAVNNTSVCKYWKILLYPPNTDTGTFYGCSTDIDTDAQYPKFHTDILVFPVFYSISILCLKLPIDSCYLSLLAL